MNTTTTRLILMRHAKSDWTSGERDDFLRPLNERGIRDARRMGRWLAHERLLPTHIVSSPSRRTRETLERVSEGAEVDLQARTRFVPALYHSALHVLLNVLAEEAACHDLMLVGHNPGLEELLSYLAEDIAGVHTSKLFPTGAVYVLELDVDFSRLAPQAARIRFHQRPKLLDR